MSDARTRHALLQTALLPCAALLMMAGIALGFQAPTSAMPMLCVSSALAGLLLLGRRRTRAAGCLLLTFLLGAALGIRTANPTLPPEGDAQVTGVVAGEVDFRAEKGQVRVILRDVTLNGERIASGAYWTFYLKADEKIPDCLTPGARISMTAEVYHPQGQRNPHGYDFRQALRQKNILIGLYGAAKLQALPDGLSLYGLAARFNHRMAQTLRDVCGEEAGQLASAVLLGMRDEVPDEEQEQFRRLGIAHILSVSGFHVGVLVALLALLMMPVKHRRLRMALTLPMLLAYAFLTGGNAPAVRAVLLWALVCWGRIRHKRVLMLHVLCASAMIQLMFAPAQLFSASFQMTYGVMAAICGITAQTAPNAQKKRSWKGKILSLLSVSAAAQFGVLLPELYWFGRVPLLGIAVNVLLVAGMNVLLLLDWVTLLLTPIPWLAALPGAATRAVSEGFLRLVNALGRFAPTLWTRQPDAWVVLGWLLVFAALLPFGKSRNRWQNRKKRLPMLAAGAALMATILLPAPFSGTEYIQLDMGDADAAVLRQEKHVLVVDAGEYGGDLASYLRAEHLPVDLLVLTHLHSDHAGGVRELLDEGIPIRRCVMPSGALEADFDEEVLPLLARMEENGTVIETVCRGDILQWAEGKLTVLFPPKGFSASNANDGSMALLVEAEGVKLLLTGDLSARYGQYAAVSADVVKAAHHGSKNGTTQAFLDESAPTAVLVSTKRENAADYLRGITDADVYSTLESGAIIIRMADSCFTIEEFEGMQ
ncbi:MAG: ComEC/Rec2 family competence protein [Clostridia bacterium]|nr:ComEC/Rec2 family competence protein [Clostridia bacterium]